MKKVNLIDAINSGKRFKESPDDDWLYIEDDILMRKGCKQWVTKELMNTQFELEEISTTITESEFDEMYKKRIDGSMNYSTDTIRAFDYIKRALFN